MANLLYNVKDAIDASRKSKKYTNFSFPSDLGAHKMMINFVEYKTYNRTNSQNILNSAYPTSTILFPIPENLKDGYHINVSESDLGVMGSVANDVTRGLMNSSYGNTLKSDAEKLVSGIASTDFTNISNLSDYAKFISRAGLNVISPSVEQGINLATGDAINPHAAINFNGIQLKKHNFSWTFAPKSSDESNRLNDIINYIKQSILPSYKGFANQSNATLSRALLNYPKLAQISLLGVDQNFYYKFKPSMVSGFDISYADQNGVAVLSGGKPAIVRISISLIELEIHTAQDYGAPASTSQSSTGVPSLSYNQIHSIVSN